MDAIIILVFLATFLTAMAIFLYATRGSASDLGRRLRDLKKGKTPAGVAETRAELIRQTSLAEEAVGRVPLLGSLQRLLMHADVRVTVLGFLGLLLAGMVVVAALLLLLTGRLLMGALGAILVAVIAFAIIYQKKNRRMQLFMEQLPDVLGMISRSLRAGHSVSNAIDLVGQEMPEPSRSLFREAHEQQQLGLKVVESLQNLEKKVESPDLRFFVTAVVIHYDVGGNLAEVLDTLAQTIRDRLRIRRQVRVHTAQGRLSGYVLAALPIVVFLLFKVLMPHYHDVLFEEKGGVRLLAGAAVLQVIGFFVIRKIIQIRI